MACRLRRQVIIWTNASLMSVGPLWRKFNEILIEGQYRAYKKMHLNMYSAKCLPFCRGLNVLTLEVSRHLARSRKISRIRETLKETWLTSLSVLCLLIGARTCTVMVKLAIRLKRPALEMWNIDSSHKCHNVLRGWVGLWGFLWWAPSAKGKDHHGVSSGWSSVWHRSNTGLSSTQYEQIPIILGVWPFWLTPFFFWSITFWRAYG